MIEIAGSEELEAGAVECDAIEVLVVGIFVGLAAVCGKIEEAGFFVEREDQVGDVFAGGDLIFQFAVGVVEIVVAPAVAFGPPDEFFAVIDDAEGLGAHPDVGMLFD